MVGLFLVSLGSQKVFSRLFFPCSESVPSPVRMSIAGASPIYLLPSLVGNLCLLPSLVGQVELNFLH